MEVKVTNCPSQGAQPAYLEGTVVALQLAAQALELAAGQDGLAVFTAEVVLLLHQLALLLLQELHLLLGVPVLLQLETGGQVSTLEALPMGIQGLLS